MRLSLHFPWSLPQNAKPLIAASRPLALVLYKMLAYLHGLILSDVLWKLAARTWDDVSGILSSLPRTVKLSHWALRAGLAYKCFTATSRLDPESEEYAALIEAMHTHWATELAAVCKANGGVYVKFGQFAVAFGVIPPEYRRVLSQLEDKARPRPFDEIEKMLLQELGIASTTCLVGEPAKGALFVEFDKVATAAASLAQVHRARLASGQEVAVKLQYPGLQRSIRADLRSMRVLSALAAMAFPNFDLAWLYNELKSKLAIELNFRNEVHNANTLRSILLTASAGKGAAYVPAIYEHLSTERMIIMEWIQGIKLTDTTELRQHSINPHAVGMSLVHLFAELTFVHGYVHGDPHPGNLMVRPKGKRSVFNWLFRGSRQRFEIVLLDHGTYLTVPTQLREQFCELWCSFLTGDKRVQAAVATAVGGERAGRVLPMLLTHTAQRKEFKSLQRSVGVNSISDIGLLLSTAPRDLVELLRINAVIRSSCSLLGVSMTERLRTMAWYARRGLPQVWSTAAHVHPSSRSAAYRTRLLLLLLGFTAWTWTSTLLGKSWGSLLSLFGGQGVVYE